jgi:hypothetical protein
MHYSRLYFWQNFLLDTAVVHLRGLVNTTSDGKRSSSIRFFQIGSLTVSKADLSEPFNFDILKSKFKKRVLF